MKPDFEQKVTKETKGGVPRRWAARKLGLYIRKVRITSGLSLSDLSEKSGLSKGNLSKVENGLTDATFSTLQDICFALDIYITIESENAFVGRIL